VAPPVGTDTRMCCVVDIDECVEGTHTCQALQRCVNMEGSFSCEGISRPEPPRETTVDCGSGYAYNQQTGSCEGESD